MNLEYFFRTVTDPDFALDTWVKISITVGLVAVMVLAMLVKNKNKALRIGICLSLAQQLILYSWYTITNYNLVTEGLPLYHCRICMLGLIIAYFFKKDALVQYLSILGLISGSMACIVIGMDPFNFPHWTNVSYVLGHYFLVFNATIILRDRVRLLFKDVLTITLMMNFFILVIDLKIGANYGYMLGLPSTLSFVPITGIRVGMIITSMMVIVLGVLNRFMPYKRELVEYESLELN